MDVGKHTLRVGSSDAVEHSLHVDAEQNEVTSALAEHFHLAPIGLRSPCAERTFTVMQHSYDAPAAPVGDTIDFMKMLQEKVGADVRVVEEAYTPADLEEGSIESAILDSGADLSVQYTPMGAAHRVQETQTRSPVLHPLPFDVEVH